MTLQQAIVWFLTAMGGAAVFCFVLLVQWYWRRERIERERLRKARMELAELSILFQSIREVIAENKCVAAGFSREVEARVDIVKDILQQSVARTRELYERQRKLAERIVALEQRLRGLEQAAGYLSPAPFAREVEKNVRSALSKPESPESERMTASPSRLIRPSDKEPQTANIGPIEDLSGTGVVSGKPVQPWQPADLSSTGMAGEGTKRLHGDATGAFVDFDEPEKEVAAKPMGSTREETVESVTDSCPEERTLENGVDPDGWRRVRQAFQELLDLVPDEENASAPISETAESPTPDDAGCPPADAGNGDQRAFEALKRRVVAYREAGMSEDAIARELGIGRGEVRLMLSLSRMPRGE